jgi:hypothetical protein
VRFLPIGLLPILVAAGPATAAEEGRGPTLTAFASGDLARPVAPGAGPGAALAAAAGVDRLPVPCASPLVQSLEPSLRGGAGRLSPLASLAAFVRTRPALPGEQALISRDGRFAVIYARAVPAAAGLMAADHDRNGHPDLADRVAEALAAASSFLEGRLGYPSPAAGRLDAYLLDLGRGLEGYAVADIASPFLVLDSALPADRIMSAVLHQAAHASLARLAPSAPGWWDEATASFLALAGTGDLAGYEAAIRARLQASGRSLPSDDLALLPGGLLWPLFLAESRQDAGIVRAVWDEAGRTGLDPLAAADTVLRRGGSSLAEAFREYCLWNLFTGSRDDGVHYPDGRRLPEAPLTAIGPGLPLVLGPVEPVEALGSVAFRLPADPRPGSLILDLRVEGDSPGADLLARYRGDDARPILVPVPLAADGSARVALPWGEARELWIVLRNGVAGTAARFEIRGVHDPIVPFDLAAFTAEAGPAGVVLQWSTASEQGLLGWNVLRADSPSGPFRRVNDVAIPAWGDGAAETGYVFVDQSARAARRHYYVLEGLTEDGLVERSFAVSARASS